MPRIGNLYGPDATFLGVPAADLADPQAWAGTDIMIIGAPFDGGTSHRPGARFGPQAIRFTDYLPHDASRPHLALGVDPLAELKVADAGDIEMPSGDTERSLRLLEEAVHTAAAAGAIPVILGGDHTIALPDATGVARHVGWGRLSVIHFDAHADTGNTQFGSLYGHGTPMRRLIESGAVRGDRFLQLGLRGYWPEPPTLRWMADQRMRSFEMTEIVTRGLDECLTEAFAIALDDCDAVFISVDVDVVDPGLAPGTGTPEPGGLSSRQLLDAVRRIAMELPVAGMDVVEVAPPYDHAEVTAYLANRVVLEALSGIAWRRLSLAGKSPRDPTWPLLRARIDQHGDAPQGPDEQLWSHARRDQAPGARRGRQVRLSHRCGAGAELRPAVDQPSHGQAGGRDRRQADGTGRPGDQADGGRAAARRPGAGDTRQAGCRRGRARRAPGPAARPGQAGGLRLGAGHDRGDRGRRAACRAGGHRHPAGTRRACRGAEDAARWRSGSGARVPLSARRRAARGPGRGRGGLARRG